MGDEKNQNHEIAAMSVRYKRRSSDNLYEMYDPMLPNVYMTKQEKERKLIEKILRKHLTPLNNKRLLEIGCGNGTNLLHLILLGFRPENLIGNELLPDRAKAARALLPPETQLIQGDASQLHLNNESFDAVLQSTVFTSILDDDFQKQLAEIIWRLVKPGGGIIWYDFIYNNPNNSDVRGVPLKRIKRLFPDANIKSWRITLAPPISRRVCKLHPAFYPVFNAFPILRTHVLCWIEKKNH